MARNGSGTYSLPSPLNPVDPGQTITSLWANTTLTDIETALTASLAADGQTVPSANLPMATYKHTGVGNATARDQYATVAQLQDGGILHLSSVAGTDTITANVPIAITAYAAGQTFRFVAAGSNTGAVTINLNAVGAVAITKSGATALEVGDIVINGVYQITYDGIRFQLIGGAGGGGAKANNCIYENATTISADYTLTTGRNGFSVGPITIATGKILTIPSGQRYVVL